MLVLALWGTAGAVEEVQLVYVGSTTTTVWRGIEQGLREANILGGYTGYTYTVEPVSPEALLGAQRDKLPLAVVAATDAETLQRFSTKFAAASVAVLNLLADDEALRQCLPPQPVARGPERAHEGRCGRPVAEEETDCPGPGACLARGFHQICGGGVEQPFPQGAGPPYGR